MIILRELFLYLLVINSIVSIIAYGCRAPWMMTVSFWDSKKVTTSVERVSDLSRTIPMWNEDEMVSRGDRSRSIEDDYFIDVDRQVDVLGQAIIKNNLLNHLTHPDPAIPTKLYYLNQFYDLEEVNRKSYRINLQGGGLLQDWMA